MEEKELTLREATLTIIDRSAAEFDLLKEQFKRAGDAFDVANDQVGLEIVSTEIFPRIRGLVEFCHAIYEYHIITLGMEDGKAIYDFNQRLSQLLEKLSKETESGNFTEIGDLLRFDFFDLITELGPFFVKIRQDFVDSKDPGLNRY